MRRQPRNWGQRLIDGSVESWRICLSWILAFWFLCFWWRHLTLLYCSLSYTNLLEVACSNSRPDLAAMRDSHLRRLICKFGLGWLQDQAQIVMRSYAATFKLEADVQMYWSLSVSLGHFTRWMSCFLVICCSHADLEWISYFLLSCYIGWSRLSICFQSHYFVKYHF